MVREEESEAATNGPKTVLTAPGIWRGITRLLPIAAFSIPFGIAFGIAAIEAGLDPWQVILMSAMTSSGSAQFAALDFTGAPIAYGSVAFVVLALNARHVIMGAALSFWINSLPPLKRISTLALLSDANFADSQPAFREGERDVGILLGGGFSLWLAWLLGTIIGVAGGAFVGDPERYGIDVVMVCFFATVVIGQFRKNRALALPILAASLVSVATMSFLPDGWNVILGAVAGGFIAVPIRAN